MWSLAGRAVKGERKNIIFFLHPIIFGIYSLSTINNSKNYFWEAFYGMKEEI